MWCWLEVSLALSVIVITSILLRIFGRRAKQGSVCAKNNTSLAWPDPTRTTGSHLKRSARARKTFKGGILKTCRSEMSEISAFSYQATSEPTQKDLLKAITPFFAKEWKVIGLQLGVPGGTLDAIEYDFPNDCRQCCNKMLREWLQWDETPTWEKVQRALQQIEAFLREEESEVDLPMALPEVEDPFQGSSCTKLYTLLLKGVQKWNWQDLEGECSQVMKLRYVPTITKVSICTFRLIAAVLCIKWDEAERLVKVYPQLKQSVEDPVVLRILKSRKEYALGCIARNKGNMEEAKKSRNKATWKLYGFNKQLFPMDFVIVNGLDTSLTLDEIELVLSYENTPRFNRSRYIQLRQELFLKMREGLEMTAFLGHEYMQLYQCYLQLKMATVYLHTYSRARLPTCGVEITKEDIRNAGECLLAVQKTLATIDHIDIWWIIFQGHIVTSDYHYHRGNLDEAHESLHKVYAVGVVHKLFDSWSVERKLQWIKRRQRGIGCACNLEAVIRDAGHWNYKLFLS